MERYSMGRVSLCYSIVEGRFGRVGNDGDVGAREIVPTAAGELAELRRVCARGDEHGDESVIARVDVLRVGVFDHPGARAGSRVRLCGDIHLHEVGWFDYFGCTSHSGPQSCW